MSPALSPNGALIVFARARGDRSELWLMNTDGSGKRRLGTPKGSETHPVWSPKSDTIAFVRLLGDQWDVVVTDLKGNRRQLTNDAAAQVDVSWSPDGGTIVFDQIEDGTSDLWTVPAGGGTPTQLTKTPGTAELNPAWSPLSDEIAYDAADAKGIYDLYILDRKTGETRRITHDAADDGDPAWSPTGKLLAYRHEVGSDYEVAKVDTTGRGKPINVSKDPAGLDLAPSWQVTTAAARETSAVRRSATSPEFTFACDLAYPGTINADTYTGTANTNHMCGAAKNDTISACGSPLNQADYLSGGSNNDHLYGWAAAAGPCTTIDRVDWLKARDTVQDWVYGNGGYDHALLDTVDITSSIEGPEY
jgi:Tol biopolymer transport system component